jgi:hypothetical protein
MHVVNADTLLLELAEIELIATSSAVAVASALQQVL